MARRKLTLADLSPNLDLEGKRVAVDESTRQIAVRVANYGEVHSGFGQEVKVPRNANLDAAHVGSAELEDGSSVRVAVLPMHTPHAPRDLTALHAASWYENSGTAIARGQYSTDESGIRFDGLLYDDVDDAKIDRLTAGSFSGDWRSAIAVKSYGELEHAPCDFVGSCLVNIGGYSDTLRKAPSRRFALVASAAGDFMSVEDGTLTAASAGPDGLSQSDVQEAWNEAHPPTAGADASETPGSWWSFEDFYFEPRSLVAGMWDGTDTDYVKATWDVDVDGNIVFGTPVPVERTWTETTEEPDDMTNTTALTAGGTDKSVTLTADAALKLLDGTATDEDRAVTRAALVASGVIDVDAEREERLGRLERFAVDSIYNQAD